MKKYLIIQFNKQTLHAAIEKVYTLQVAPDETLESALLDKLGSLPDNYGVIDLNTIGEWNYMQSGNTSVRMFNTIQFFSISEPLPNME